MDLHVDHRTDYAYSEPNKHSIQYIRLTPGNGPGQHVQEWQIKGPGTLTTWKDGFSNTVHTMVVAEEHDTLSLQVKGTIITDDTGGILPYTGAEEAKAFLIQPTALTAPSPAMYDLVADAKRGRGPVAVDLLHDLMQTIATTRHLYSR